MSHIGFNINDFFIKYDEYEKDIINKFKNINNMIIKFYWGYPNARYELEELLNNIETDKKYLILFINDYNDSYVNNKEDTDRITNEAIKFGGWEITHCHTDTNILDIPTVTYNIEDIGNLFDSLCI